MRFFAAALLLAIAATALPAAAKDSWVLAPSAPWTIDYADDSCALRRMFGTGSDQVFLELRRFGPGVGTYAIVSSNRFRARKPPRFRYRFGEQGDWRDVYGLGVSGDGFSGVIFSSSLVPLPAMQDAAERETYLRVTDLTGVERERAAAVDTFYLDGAFGRDLQLQTGSLAAPMRALNECVDELVTHWNIDIEAHKTLTRPPAPIDLAAAARMIDYPPKMLRQNMPGLVHIRLAIDEKGRITECHIQMPLSDPVFEETSCADIQHAFEFEPALDKDGNPIASYWLTSIRFTLGG
jgi:hypothetical protein